MNGKHQQMSSARYVRWQGLAMAQLSIAVALITGLSVAGLGTGLTLLREDTFKVSGCWKWAFGLSQLFFISAALLGCAAVITRLLDFRLTAREVRKQEKPDYKKSLKIFGCDADSYGKTTWRLFWPCCALLVLGLVLLACSIVDAYGSKVF
jgi:hypothetical protein